MPKGKKKGKCLREIEKEIQKSLHDQTSYYAANNVTLNDMYDEYIKCKLNLKESTRTHYEFLYKRFVRPVLGGRLVSSFKYSDIKNFYFKLYKYNKLSLSTINCINAILNPIFNEALRDGIIRISPTWGAYAELRKNTPNKGRKIHALTENEQECFLNYLRNSKYSNFNGLFTFLLGTGCRIGEALGLTWSDCDFKRNIISINHSLTVRNIPQKGKDTMYISTPKTEKSVRVIPMFSSVKRALLDIQQEQITKGVVSPVINNYTGFVFLGKNDNLLNYSGINKVIYSIVKKYNKQELVEAKSENREANLLPKFSVHNLRHTFCTRLCKNETNLKIIQEIMGHSSVQVTMDIYNEVNTEQKVASFINLDGKFGI